MLRNVLCSLAAIALAACAAQARLYDLESGQVLTADYTKGVPHGELVVHHPDGPCTGEYSTVVSGSWGAIFASGAGGATASAQGMSVGFAQRGAAVAVCPGGRTIECEYVSSGRGTGYCRDNRGGRYRLMF